MSKYKGVVAVAVALSAFPITAGAQNVINADSAAAQVTVNRDDKGFYGCGVRIVVQVILPKQAETYDFSLNLNAQLFAGTLKAGKYLIPANASGGWDLEKRKTVIPAPSTFWFAAQSQDVPLKPIQVLKAEDAGFTLGVADFTATGDTIMEVFQGKRIQFALRYPSDKLDRIVSFSVAAAQQDKETFADCMTGLERRIKREAEASKKK